MVTWDPEDMLELLFGDGENVLELLDCLTN